METYEEWLGNPDDLDRFQEIQYEKKLFPASAPPEIIYQFCKGLPKQLQEFQLSLLNGTTNKHIRKFAGKSDIYIIKMRINDNWRAVMLLRDHLLTLLMVTDHDSQADAIERKFTGAAFARLQDRIGREKNGLVMKPMHEFLHLCYIFFNRGRSKCTANAFKKAFNSEVDYILDRNQKRTVDTVNNTTITNVIVIGNAGAGKSTAGLIWLTKYPDRKAKRLYLTMSDLLADTYQNKYHRANSLREQMGLPQLPAITFHTVFGFMADTARRFVDEGSGLLTPEQSFQVFGEAMREAGEDARTSFCRTLSENAGLKYLYWREIHGIIKGSLIDRALGTPDFTLSSPLGKKAYEAAARRHREKMARKFKRVEGETYIRREKLFDVFHVYQRYLKQHQMLDDNDIARIVFEHIQLHQMDPDRGNEFFQKLRAEHSLDAYQTLRMNIIGLSDEHYQDGLYCHSNGLMDIYDEYQHHTKNPKPLKQILESLDGTDDRVLPYLDDWYEQTMQRLQDELKELAGQAEEYTKGRKANG